MITFIFANDREKYLGYGETATGIGLMLGPVLGSALNTLVGYTGAFFFFAGLLLVFGILSHNLIPSTLNNKFSDP